jgi:hypothetical protein
MVNSQFITAALSGVMPALFAAFTLHPLPSSWARPAADTGGVQRNRSKASQGSPEAEEQLHASVDEEFGIWDFP